MTWMPASARAVISSHGVGPKLELGPPCTSMTSGATLLSPLALMSHVSMEWPSGCLTWTCSTVRENGPYQALPSVVSLRSFPSSTAQTSLGPSLVAATTATRPPPAAIELHIASGVARAPTLPLTPNRYGWL